MNHFLIHIIHVNGDIEHGMAWTENCVRYEVVSNYTTKINR